MICKRCGAALPSDGVTCKQCGAMMTKEQIEEQKKWKEINKEHKKQVELMSNKYNVNKENFEYDTKPQKENKFLGLIVVVGILFAVIILAIIKFLG